MLLGDSGWFAWFSYGLAQNSKCANNLLEIKTKKPICLITGVGGGAGVALARRFANGGYHVAMLARNRDRLIALENEFGDAKAYSCDISDRDVLQATIKSVRFVREQIAE